MPLSPKEIAEVLALGHELRHIEFKVAGNRAGKSYQAVVVRALMAMGNLPDGGHVILGIAEASGQLTVTGLSHAQVTQWTDHDEVADVIGRFSDPIPVVQLSVVEVGSSKVIDIEVEPFADTPYLCRRDSPDVLQSGRMYVRRVGKAETGNPTHHELREVLDRAAARRVRNLLATLGAAGVETLGLASDAESRYAEERGTVSGDADRIAFETLGHWSVQVHPTAFERDRIPRGDLESVIEAATVRLRGWPVPFIPSGGNAAGPALHRRRIRRSAARRSLALLHIGSVLREASVQRGDSRTQAVGPVNGDRYMGHCLPRHGNLCLRGSVS